MAVAAPPASASASELSRFTSRRLGTTRERVRSVAWNQDGRRLATGGADKSLRIYLPEKDPRTSTECRGHTGEVSSLRWNPTHPERLASCSASEGSKPTSTIETYGDNINMAWSPDGKTIVVGNRSDRLLWVDVEQQTTNEVLFSHNGSLLISAIEGRACINAFPSNEPVHSIRISPVPTTVMDLDPRGRYLAAGSNDATLTLWDTQEWTCVSSMGAHDDPLRACRFSHDGAYIASTCSDSEIVISEVPSLRKVHSIKPVNSDSLAWHPSRLLLAYGGDGAHIWGSGV
ncbi:SPOSA6832_04044 [Sporobolomyces salmonicolor]|uniref:SPOSA6832_04044-mRNA-1:cds n=1 Tax=Sporidiobolus salmonicolor TaxID=5005 RepID=A0A0D6EQW5_SPOSA|nr:SPOSA6832_04044 [Sporobolomyces salmonicolor]